MKHLIAVSRTSGPLPADILGTRALVGLLTELMQLISGVSQVLKGNPFGGGGGGGGDDEEPHED